MVIGHDADKIDKWCTVLEANLHCDCWRAYRYQLAVRALHEQDFDMVLLALPLADKSGLDLLRHRVGATECWRYLVICDHHNYRDRESALLLDVFGCLSAPFSPLELVQHAKRLLAAHPRVNEQAIDLAHGLVFLPGKRLIVVNGRSHRLTPSETNLLEYLYNYNNQVVPRARVREILGLSQSAPENAINARVRRLRIKLEQFGERIVTYYRDGYQLSVR